jgi:hypothetical protein
MRAVLTLLLAPLSVGASETVQERVATVTKTPGLVAFWDFTKREAPGKRFTAHVPAGATNDYALDVGNYVKDLWHAGPDATYADFPMLGAGPFGRASARHTIETGISVPSAAFA